jgi:hypothetical protein
MICRESGRILLSVRRKMVGIMSTEELESLENLSDDENAKLWAEEAERRDQAWDVDPTMGRPAADIFRDARARLK